MANRDKKLKLWAPKDSNRAKKCLIVAKWVDVEVEVPVVVMGETNKSPEFLRKNPFGKIPVLETPEGPSIFESSAIIRYLAELKPGTGLLGRNAIERAQIDQWCDFNAGEVEVAAFAWLGPILGYIPYSQESYDFAQGSLKKIFDGLNRHLESRTYLVGERVTIADIVLATTLLSLYQRVLEPRWRAPFPNVNRWFETITQKQQFASVWSIDPSTWCVVAQKAKKDDKKEEKKEEPKAETKAEGGKGKKEEKKEEKKPEAKKEKAKKKDDDDDEEPEEGTEEPKAKNPLDSLPKSTFILDDFKRTFSNNPVPVTIEYLNKNFDPAGWSMWFADYKYNDELTKVFMTANLVQGFFNRMDRMRKYAFGAMSICGEDKAQNLSGFWIIRSNEIPQVMRDECDDVDLYTWTKIDFPPTGAVLDKVIAYLSKGPIDGKAYEDGRWFK